jgi:hypothetical protein
MGTVVIDNALTGLLRKETKMETYFCECCGRKLNPKTMVSLELDQRDDTYHDFGDVPEDQSQGGFLFGAACAKKKIAEAQQIRNQSKT